MATTPWKSPASAGRSGTGWGGTGADWTAATISAADGTFTGCLTGNTDGAPADPAWAYGFGFSADIPAGATIDGIEIRDLAGTNNSTRFARLDQAYLIFDGATGTASGTSQATKTPRAGSPPSTTEIHGGATNLWGLTPTREQVVDPNFGCRLIYARDMTTGTANFSWAEVDHVEMRVHYTEGGGGGLTLDVPTGGFALTGNAPALLRSYRLAPPAGSFALTGHAPDLAVGLRLDAPAGSYAATGYAPSLTRALRMETAAGAYALTGHAPDLARALRMDAAAGSYSLTGHAPGLSTAGQIAPPAGGYTLTGHAPALIRAYRLDVPAAAYAVTGHAPVIIAGRTIQPEAGSYVLEGHAPALLRALRLAPGAGLYALTGLAPTIAVQGEDEREADVTIVSVARNGVVTIIGPATGPYTITSQE